MAKNTIVGFIVSRTLKPAVLLSTQDGQRFQATVDTGFNGQLLMDMGSAVRLGVQMSGEFLRLHLAGNIPAIAQTGWVYVDWLGSNRFTTVTVLQRVAQLSGGDIPDTKSRDREVLLGTHLLHPNRLFINFLEERVRIRRS